MQANIAAVFTYYSEHQKDDPRTVAYLAQANGIPVYYDSPRNHMDTLRETDPDIMLSLYYRDILPQEVFSLAKTGAFNMHGSLLPKFRGRSPVNWAIISGAQETGATLHMLTARIDAGDIVDSEPVRIGPLDTAGLVQERVDDAAAEIIRRQYPLICSRNFRRKPQDLSQGRYYGGRSPQDSQINWADSAWNVHNLIRSLQPHPRYPTAFCHFGEEVLYCFRSAWPSVPLSDSYAPGTVVEHIRDGIVVACGERQGLLLTSCSFDPDMPSGAQASRDAQRKLLVGTVLQ